MSTPYGKLGFRKQQPKWNYDEETILNYLTVNGHNELIRIKKEVNKAELKKVLKISGDIAVWDTGEIAEGITIEPQEDSIKIEVGEE